MKKYNIKLKIQDQFVAGFLLKNGTSEISEELKEQLLKDNYAKDLIKNNLLVIETVDEIVEKKVTPKKKKERTIIIDN